MELQIRLFDRLDRDVAEQLHRVWLAAYTQEARLIGAERFPPLEHSIDDLLHGDERFLAALVDGQLVGALGSETNADESILISSLVVDPLWHRQGIASQLVGECIDMHRNSELIVGTAERNMPAIELYKRFRFELVRRWIAEPGSIECVELRRRVHVSRIHV